MKNAAFFLVASQYVCTAAWLKLIELFPIAQRLFKNCCPCVSFHHCLNGLFFNSMNLVNFWHFIKLLEEVEISQVISNQHSKVIQLQYKGRRNAYTFEYQARYQMTHQRDIVPTARLVSSLRGKGGWCLKLPRGIQITGWSWEEREGCLLGFYLSLQWIAFWGFFV